MNASSSRKVFTNTYLLLRSRPRPRISFGIKRSMQAQQSLFQSAFQDPNQRVAHGVRKSIPFLNLWAPSPSVQQHQAAQAQKRNMASATSFYDFKPLDSKLRSICSARRPQLMFTSTPPKYSQLITPPCRERPSRPSHRLQRQGSPHRQYRLKMRLHTPIRRPGKAVQENQGRPR